MRKNKKGYTLIEIIIAIALITVIATISIVSITNIKKSSEAKKLNNAFKVFDNALDVYLSNHSEIYENIQNNVEGAVITLEVLKNEGLVSDKIINPITNKLVDYKNNYYVLADAVVDEENQDEEKLCDGRVAISVLKSWDELSKNGLDENNVIYICPRSESKTDDSKIKELEERIDRLQSAINLSDLGSKNWVIFDVNSDKSQLVSFSEDETIQDLWQVVGKSGDEIKLIYNTYADSDNSKTFAEFKENEEKISYNRDITIRSMNGKRKGSIPAKTDFYKITYTNAGYDLDGDYDREYSGYELIKYQNEYYLWSGSGSAVQFVNPVNYLYKKLKNYDLYVDYHSNTGWTVQEMFKETYKTDGSKKQILYNAINNNLRDSIVQKSYFYQYDTSDDASLNSAPIYSKTYNDIFGTINPGTDGLNNSETMKVYLGKDFAVGYYSFSIKFKDYNGIAGLRNGKVDVSDSSKCNPYNEIGCKDTYYYTNSGQKRDSYLYYINNESKKYLGYYIPTAPYIPVITIKGYLLSDSMESYPNSYKQKYPSCTDDKLGTKGCPRLFKLQNGYYSNGTK